MFNFLSNCSLQFLKLCCYALRSSQHTNNRTIFQSDPSFCLSLPPFYSNFTLIQYNNVQLISVCCVKFTFIVIKFQHLCVLSFCQLSPHHVFSFLSFLLLFMWTLAFIFFSQVGLCAHLQLVDFYKIRAGN